MSVKQQNTQAIEQFIQTGGRVQKFPPAERGARSLRALGRAAEAQAARGEAPNVLTRAPELERMRALIAQVKR